MTLHEPRQRRGGDQQLLRLSACIQPVGSSPHEVASLCREILLRRSLRRDARPAIGKNRGNNYLIAIGVIVPKLYVGPAHAEHVRSWG